ncbi:hypothetical protein GCM10011425_04900 [Mucilaginibacter galii]|uniref:Uncharacterized protein n=2 Tax=Mucilaginibacter galii TaxID=2005073 RepID=A0A917N008_9SPHI|nr:hypothetical protein GCM10011425_04900 [Mucilaginibacter galii]
MGFGANLFFVFILIPGTLIMLIAWIFTRNIQIGRLLLFGWACVIALVILDIVVRVFTEKKQLERDDIYGTYVIDRSKFPGKQADWQYNHYWFAITKDGKLNFHITNKARVVKTYQGFVSFKEDYVNPRLVIQLPEPHHHIMEVEPTLYRDVFSFYYVFKSPRFGNVFFTKGEWKPID